MRKGRSVFVVEENDHLQGILFYSRVHGVYRKLEDAINYVEQAEAVNCVWRDERVRIIDKAYKGIQWDEVNECYLNEVYYWDNGEVRYDSVTIREMKVK